MTAIEITDWKYPFRVKKIKNATPYEKSRNLFLSKLIFALLYLRSDFTSVPLADAKLSGPCDAFEKGC